MVKSNNFRRKQPAIHRSVRILKQSEQAFAFTKAASLEDRNPDEPRRRLKRHSPSATWGAVQLQPSEWSLERLADTQMRLGGRWTRSRTPAERQLPCWRARQLYSCT